MKDKLDIKEHVLLFKHEKLDEKSVEELIKKYNISKNQLPKIFKKDPALSSIEEIKVGDVIKVTRPSNTAKLTLFYRAVIDG